MRIGLVSDSHGNTYSILRAVEEMGDIDLLVHLGDFTDDLVEIKKHIKTPYELIKGNNDYYHGEREALWNWEWVTVFATHGDLYDVAEGTDKLIERARSLRADIALFGHTHKPLIHKQAGIWLVNPGSLGFGENARSAAVVEINGSRINPEPVSVKSSLEPVSSR